jgi:hypothetical protein
MTSPTTESWWCFCGLQNLFRGQRPTLYYQIQWMRHDARLVTATL